MDVIARLPDCDGQAADAVFANTQVKVEDASRLLRIPKPECPDIWIRLPKHKWPKSWSNIEHPVVPFGRNLYGHPLAELLWERQFEEVLLKLGVEKSTKLGMSVCSSKNKDYSYRYGHPLPFEEVLLELGWVKGPNWEFMFVHRKTKIILVSFCG